MTVLISAEPYSDATLEEIKPLLVEHHRELALWRDEIPLAPDYDAYRRGLDSGGLRLYTVRLGGALIGYATFGLTPRHLHYAHRWAVNDIIWLHEAHRNFGLGTELCVFFEDDLARDGPVVIVIETKAHVPALAILLRGRGYSNVGEVLAKRFA